MKPLRLIAVCFAVGCLAPRAGADPASGPYAPVPAGSWPYAAVRELVAADYFTGYPEATFADGHVLTRFDFSVAVQRLADQVERRVSLLGGQEPGAAGRPATAAGVERVAADLQLLQQLAGEFSTEYAAAGHDPQQLEQRLARLSQRVAQAGARAEGEPAKTARPAAHRPAAGHPGSGGERLRPLRTDLRPSSFGLRALSAGLLPGAELPDEPRPADGLSVTGPLGLSVQVDATAGALAASQRLPLVDPQESSAVDARLSLPLGRTLVSGFYRRIGDQFSNGPGWLPEGVPGIQGMAGFGGAVTTPLGSFLRLHLEGGTLRDQEHEARGGALFVRSGIGVPLGRHSQIGLGYERLQFGGGALAGDTAEQYNLGLGHSFSQNTSFELRAQFGRMSRGLYGEQNAPVFDNKSYSAVTQFRVRF